MKNNIVFLVVTAIYGSFCQGEDVGDAEVAGSRYMQGIVRYCTLMHNTDTDQIVKTYNYELDNQDAKCAIMCILQSSQIMDQDGEFREDEMQRVLDKIPDDEKKAEIQNTLKECIVDGASESQSNCDKAFIFTKCLTKLKNVIPEGLLHIPSLKK